MANVKWIKMTRQRASLGKHNDRIILKGDLYNGKHQLGEADAAKGSIVEKT